MMKETLTKDIAKSQTKLQTTQMNNQTSIQRQLLNDQSKKEQIALKAVLDDKSDSSADSK
jgi:hypothetical protein